MYNSLVSIIVPVYNTEKYLRRCLDSIINQTYKNLEIILVDDGSIDCSREIINEYAKRDKRIIRIFKTNGGQSSARNLGLEARTGSYIMFVDSDDWIDVNAVSILVDLMNSNKADIIIFNYYAIYKNNIKILNDTTGNCRYNSEEIKRKLLMDYWINSVVDKIYSSEVFANVRFPVGLTYEDAYIMPELLSNCKEIVCIKDALYYYDRSNNMSTTKVINSKNLFDIYKGWRQKGEYASILTLKEKEYCIKKAFYFAKQAFYLNLLDDILNKSMIEEIVVFVNGKLSNDIFGRLEGALIKIKYKIKKKLSNNPYIWLQWRKYVTNKGD